MSTTSPNITDPVTIVEVSPRDGLQNESVLVYSDHKLALIGHLVTMGAKRVEVVSFVNPRRVPQMGDAEQVALGLPEAPGVRFIGLCLNERGVARAIATQDNPRPLDEAGCVLVASDTFGVVNQGQKISDGILANNAMLKMARDAGLYAQVTISAAFGCPYEGPVPADRVVELAKRMADAGAQEIALADTIGVAVPSRSACTCTTPAGWPPPTPGPDIRPVAAPLIRRLAAWAAARLRLVQRAMSAPRSFFTCSAVQASPPAMILKPRWKPIAGSPPSWAGRYPAGRARPGTSLRVIFQSEQIRELQTRR
jgi:hypothetical protein